MTVVQIHESSRDSSGTWGVNLDVRPLRTPLQKLFEVDNEAVAHAVANEWAIQKDIVMLSTMHMVCFIYSEFKIKLVSLNFDYLKYFLCNFTDSVDKHSYR